MTFTKEQLIEKLQHRISVASGFPESEKAQMDLELARIALASLEADVVAWTDEQELRDVEKYGCGYLFTANPVTPNADPHRVIKLYAAPPAPVSVPDVVSWEDVPEEITEYDIALASAWAHGFNQCRAAMLQGAEPVSNRDELTDAVNGLLAVMDEYPETLVPINRDSAVVRQLRVAAGD
ncbi:hypothetical protein [Enterobacter hormaechei]|uniref:hypothetical protein n=1 Tax=Enterobacter hormaechei TaxID=158836 RepID=UPI0007352988|nr:hypothetical protein [Enterobacter hormaechei]KTH02741.1 hypothetical protein ASV32_21770 [Enterobacter hormaechei subsp. xiangfangensis]WMA20017.1 hypothetical protein QPR56_17245 [Enterobacter hormaechei]